MAHDQTRFASALNALWPHGDATVPGLRAGIIASAPAVFAKYGCDSNLVIAHIMGEFSEESGCGNEMMENMNYSAARLLQVFPSHFNNAQAIACQHNPRAIADKAYGGRMGNAAPPSDDGWNYRGQGLSQLTGRDNYEMVSRMIGLDPNAYPQFKHDHASLKTAEFQAKYPILFDLLSHPEMIRSPEHALEVAVADFVYCGCLPFAIKDDIVGVASELNEGHYDGNPAHINGYQLRVHWTALWKHAMGVA